MTLGGWGSPRRGAPEARRAVRGALARTRSRVRRAAVIASAAVVGLGVVAAAGTLAVPSTAGAATGNLVATPTALTFFNVPLGTYDTTSVTIHATTPTTVFFNTTTPSHPPSASVSSTQASQFVITGNTCRGRLAGGGTCFVGISFQPTTIGAHDTTLTVQSLNGFAVVVPITATAAPAFHITPASHTVDFGGIGVGDTSPAQIVTLYSTQSGLKVTSVSATPTSVFSITLDSCAGATLTAAPTTSCTVGVAFTPSRLGNQNGSLSLTLTGHVVAVALQGTGVPNTTATLTTTGFTPVAFGTVPVGSAKTGKAILTNTGTNPLTVSGATIGGLDPSDFALENPVSACGSQVPAHGTCTIAVAFAPTTVATGLSATLLVTANVAAPGTVLSIALSGNGETPSSTVSVTPASQGWGSVKQGTRVTKPFTVHNGSSQSVRLGTISTFSGDYAVTGGTCDGALLASHKTCTFSVTFDPGIVGADDTTLQVPVTGGSPVTAALYGTGVAIAKVTVSPAAVAFGATPVGQHSGAHRVTVTNTGQATVTGVTLSFVGPTTTKAQFSFVTQQCTGLTLAPGHSCSDLIDFTPTAVATPVNAALRVTDSAGTFTVALSGIGTADTTATLTPTSHSFGTVPAHQASAPQRFTLTNTGTAPLDVASVKVTGTVPAASQAFSIVADGCTQTKVVTLAPTQSCTVYVVFAPGSVTAFSAELEVKANLTGGTSSPGLLTAELTGNGTTPSQGLTATPADLTFGSVGRTVPAVLPVTITNHGAAPVSLGTVSVSPTGGPFTVTGNCATAHLSSNASCTERVTFKPAQLGADVGSLTVAVQTKTGLNVTVGLYGTGVPATTVSITPSGSPGVLTFPATPTTTKSPEQFVKLSNTGSNVLHVTTSLALTTKDFAVVLSTCTGAVAPGDSCYVGLKFTPTKVQGWVTATLVISDNASSFKQVVHLRGDATANGVPYTVSATHLTFGTVGVGTTSTKTLTITNTSTSTLALATPPVTLTDTVNYAIGVDTCVTSTTGTPLTLDTSGTAGSSCTVQVTFQPASNGPHPASAVVSPAKGISTVVTLSGAGVPPVVSATLTPPATGTLTFPATPVGTSSAPENEIITVTGNMPLAVTAVTVGGTTAAAKQFSVVGDTCKDNTTLLVGAKCEISVVFSPTSNGVKAAQLLITDNAPGSPQVVNLVGTGGTAPTGSTGYDMVGSDGGVFVFNPPGVNGGFYGSLPGIHVKPAAPIVGIVSTTTNHGYFLVGADGGVFAFGPTAPFHGSLPGIHVKPAAPIVGIVAANTDKGYFLVGADGGVFAFGTVPFLGSLPGSGIQRDNIIGIASTPSGDGYWVISATGTVYGFGKAGQFGTVGGSTSPVSSIAGTPTGGGYWVATQNGTVYNLGDAASHGTLPALDVTPAKPVIGIVRTAKTGGYWLIGSDGGIFAFGNASFYGSLPGLNIHVTNIVGAVPN